MSQPTASVDAALQPSGREASGAAATDGGLGSVDPRRDDAPGQCHLCGDVAVTGRIIALDATTRLATVMLCDGPAIVAMDFVDAAVGDDVLVQLGFALERLAAP